MKKKLKLFIYISFSFLSNILFSQTNSWYLWGNNSFGVFGNGTIGSGSSFFEPTLSNHLDTFTKFFPAQTHIYALDKQNILWAWGDNGLKGQLGINSNKAYFETPQKVETNNIWKTISALGKFTVGIHSNGTLWIWGRYSAYPTNYGGSNGIDETLPVLVDTSRNWIEVKVGFEHILLLKSDNSLWSMGINNSGALGLSKEAGFSPAKVITPQLVMNDVKHFETFSSSCYAITKNGELYTWGRNARGLQITGELIGEKPSNNLPFMDSQFYTIPHRVNNDKDWKIIKTNNFHTLALKTNNTLWAWGTNEYGQLGIGNFTNATSPIQVGTENKWNLINISGSNSFATKADSTLWAWGRGGETLGAGFGSKDQNTPLKISDHSNWTNIYCSGLTNIASRQNTIETNSNRNLQHNLRIYPNPTNSILNISVSPIPSNTTTNIKLIDLSGRLLICTPFLGLDDFQISIKEKLGTGIFILNIELDNHQIFTEKIIVY